jgi:predicted HAD superfamily Cof-like phosphohydrolase
MRSTADMVREFHETFGLLISHTPTVDLPSSLVATRRRILEEEVAELSEALEAQDLTSIAKEMADLVYVVYGTAVTYGIDLDAVLSEVHRSNMSKLGPDGSPVLRPDGKVLKGPGYQPPDVQAVLRMGVRGPTT